MTTENDGMAGLNLLEDNASSLFDLSDLDYTDSSDSDTASPEEQIKLKQPPFDVSPSNDYIFQDEIGRGSFGNVYRATDKKKQENVAAKRIHIRDDEDMNNAFKEAASLLSIIPHQNILKLLNYFVKGKNFWMILEYCNLGNLEDYFKAYNPPLTTALQFMHMTACAISHMHGQLKPIVHRDIKPTNILLKSGISGPIVKVADFGMAKIIDLESEAVHTILMTSTVGTPGYMAPEFFMNQKYTKSVDVFSLGLVLLATIKYKPGQGMKMPQTGDSLLANLFSIVYLDTKIKSGK